MRLIDADRLKDEIVQWLSTDDGIEQRDLVSIDDIAASVIQTIDEQPTAYNVNKVVEILQYAKSPYSDIDLRQYNNALELAIDIVKRGGI